MDQGTIVGEQQQPSLSWSSRPRVDPGGQAEAAQGRRGGGASAVNWQSTP